VAHCLENRASILLTEPEPDLFLVHREQVLVLERRRWLEVLTLDNTVDHGTFEIEDAEDVRDSLHSILHDDELDRLLVLHAHRVDAINTGD